MSGAAVLFLALRRKAGLRRLRRGEPSSTALPIAVSDETWRGAARGLPARRRALSCPFRFDRAGGAPPSPPARPLPRLTVARAKSRRSLSSGSAKQVSIMSALDRLSGFSAWSTLALAVALVALRLLC